MAAKPSTVYWPAGVADCRPAAQPKFSRESRAEQRWFLQSLLLQELQRDSTSTDEDLQRVKVTPETLKKAVDAEIYSEDFPDALQFVVEAVSACSIRGKDQWTKELQEQYCGALMEVLGFCDENTAHTALGLLKESSSTVVDFADCVGCLLEHEGSGTGEMCRKLQACLALQKASAGDLITGLGSIGSSIATLLERGMGHDDAACRARAANVLLQAGLHSRERDASDAALTVLCRSALYDGENRPFLLSAAWDLLLVHPSSCSATVDNNRNSSMDAEETTALAFLLGFLRFGQEDSSELEAACITALGAAKLIMHHADLEATEVIQCRLNAALVQCRRLHEIRSKQNHRPGSGSGNSGKLSRAGKSKDTNPLRIILEDFERRFRLHCDQLGEEEVCTYAHCTHRHLPAGRMHLSPFSSKRQ